MSNDKGLQIAVSCLETFEGCVLKPYLCPANVCTIGIGSTRYMDGRPISMRDAPITRALAQEMAEHDLASAAKAVDKNVTQPLTDSQRAALILFVQNLGAGALGSSTLLRKLNAGNFAGAQLEFHNWNNIRLNGKLVPSRGLSIRRYTEAQIFGGVDPRTAYEAARKMFR